MSAIRHLSVLALAAALVLLGNLAERRPRRVAAGTGKRRPPRPARVRGPLGRPGLYPAACGLLAVFLLAAAAALRLARPGFEAGRPETFFTMKPAIACPRAADFILEQSLPDPIFNDYPSGAYLGARLHPAHRVFIDSRVLDSSVVVDYTAMVDSERSWRRAEARYGFRTVILGNYSQTVRSALGATLARDRAWRLVYVDPLAVIFVRSDATPASLQPRLGPADELRGRVPFADPPGYAPWAAALQRIFLNDTPGNYLVEYLAVLGHLGRAREALELADRALAAMPDRPLLHRQRCAAKVALGDPRSAVADCERAAELRPSDPQIVLLYCDVLERVGERAEARRVAAAALRRHPGDPRLRELRQRLNR